MLRAAFAATFLSLILLAGTPAKADAPTTISPREAVMLAADAAPDTVSGTFALKVQSTGRERGVVYLNSELDYRDQRNLTVALSPQVVRQLQDRLGTDPAAYLKDKNILVRGAAMRVRIDFSFNQVKTGKYYYQTHVRVMDADQISVADP